MTNIQKPRKHVLSDHKTVIQFVNELGELGAIVDHQRDAGTIKVWLDDDLIYQAMQKGSGQSNWIVSYRTDYFTV